MTNKWKLKKVQDRREGQNLNKKGKGGETGVGGGCENANRSLSFRINLKYNLIWQCYSGWVLGS